jgi:hypothetical protein
MNRIINYIRTTKHIKYTLPLTMYFGYFGVTGFIFGYQNSIKTYDKSQNYYWYITKNCTLSTGAMLYMACKMLLHFPLLLFV